MDRTTVISLIRDFQDRAFDGIIHRDLVVPHEMRLKKSITIIGPRRSGKTWYLFQAVNALCKNIDRNRQPHVVDAKLKVHDNQQADAKCRADEATNE